MKHVLMDIETCPRIDDELLAQLAIEAESKVPANYKDPAKIAAKAQEVLASLVEKAALNPRTGGIWAITYGIADEGRDNMVIDRFDPLGLDPAGFARQENVLLQRFITWWDSQPYELVLTGFNMRQFDLPFMVARLIRNRVFPSSPFPIHGRQWKHVLDFMDIFTFGKLNEVLQTLGIADKGRSGHKLHEAPDEEITAYLQAEALAMVELYEGLAKIQSPQQWR